MGRGNEVEISMILFHEISTSSSSWERKKKMWSLLSLSIVAWMFVVFIKSSCCGLDVCVSPNVDVEP